MRFPIDTTNMKFGSGGKPVPVIDFATKLPKTDENGVPLFKVPLVVITDDGPEIFDVRVVGEPKGLSDFSPVKVTNLVAQNWDMGTAHGISFRADRIESIKPAN